MQRLNPLLVLLIIQALPGTALADSAWISDEFEVTLRSGPSTSNAIQLMLSSGTRVEVIERDADSGYARVRTPGGTEGFVLTRYLMGEPSAREQLQALTSQLTTAETRGSSLTSQLEAIRGEYSAAESRIATLLEEKSAVEEELADIRQTSANVLSINQQNKSLREQLADAEIQVATLQQENRDLSRQTTRYWFMTGAAVLLVGMVLGLWLPRIRWQRRSRYDRF